MENSNHIQVWNDCLGIIKNITPPAVFEQWFKPVKPVSLIDSVLTIEVPSDEHMRQLESDRLIDILAKTLKRVIGEDVKLKYNVRIVADSYATYPHQNEKFPVNKDIPFPRNSGEILNPMIIPGIQKLKIDPGLNPKYSFDNFVEGQCNRLGRSAGEQVAENPGNNPFNPLFIYGGSALGKTHLAQAIGLKVKEKYPDKIVLFVSANRFQTQYMDAVYVKNKLTDFLHFYQMIDVLIIDDVQEFAKKEGTQSAFFHVFNHLHQLGKQLVITSDCAPGNMQGLNKRLLSRFKWGLSAELLPPDYDTRIKLLKFKSAADGLTLPEDVITYLAERITGSVREIEGALNALLAHSTINREDITLDLAKRVTEQIVNVESSEISVDKIRCAVCDYFKISQDQIVSKTRKREIVQARQITMYLVRNLTKTSLASIGTQIGGKDHATVLHACNTVQDLIETDRNIKRYVSDLEKQLTQSAF